jgi:hypothetical protein
MATIWSKEKARRWAIKEGRKVLWKDKEGGWHAATDRWNTPKWATETEDLESDRKV